MENHHINEQDLVTNNNTGVKQTRHKYLTNVATNKVIGDQTGSQKHSSNKPKPIPAPNNWGYVEKLPPPKTASNMKSMFDSGNIPDIHPVEKMPITFKLGEGAAMVYENQPDYREGVVRETDYSEELKPIIPDQHARQMKQLWNERGKNKECLQRKEQVRFTPEREMTPPSTLEEAAY